MAGIGLTLRKLVADQTYLNGAVAYFSSGIISAGPWLISVVSLALLKGAFTASLTSEDRMLLFATITYAFVGSLILTGPIQIVLTRTVADHIFLDEVDAIAPTFTQALAQSSITAALVLLPFLMFAPFEAAYRLIAGGLFLTVSLIWLALVVLSAAQDFVSIVSAFVIGYAIGICATLWFSRSYGLLGALEGFTLGQVVCLALLSKRLYLEFPQGRRNAAPFSQQWRKYWRLALIGLLYYAGLWADKVFYWFSPGSSAVRGFYRTFPPYDSAMLLAYLLAIPASAVILLNLETDFYQHYRAFYGQILRKGRSETGRAYEGTFEQITQARLGMIKAAGSGFWTLLKIQGALVIFAVIIAPDLARLIGLANEHLITLRIAIGAASAQVFVLYAVLLLMYLDAWRETLKVVLAFAAGNLGLTLLMARLVPGHYGLGYLLATLGAALFGAWLLKSSLARLDYVTFMMQPLEAARTGKRPESSARTPRRSPWMEIDKESDHATVAHESRQEEIHENLP